MTRQEAIEILNNKAFTFCNFERCVDFYTVLNCGKCNEALSMAIKALQQEPKWIPVTERLPEIGDTVIISGKMKYKDDKDYEEFVDVAIFEVTQRFETFNDWYEGQDEFEIVAWQPLPEPYEEADE